MPGFDPNEPRDYHGRWTAGDAGAAIKRAASSKGEEIAYAPYRSRPVNSPEEDQKIRAAQDYKDFQQTVQDAAKLIGVNITDTLDTWGGYVDSETGKPVQEVSNVIHVDADQKKAELLAAVIGSAAPEMQDSVLVGSYKEGGPGTEYTIKTGSFENARSAISSLKSNNLQYYTVNKKNGDIILLDLDNSNTRNTLNFISDLKKRNLYEGAEFSETEGTFVGSGDYQRIIKESGNQTRSKEGITIDAFIEKSKERYKKITNAGL